MTPRLITLLILSLLIANAETKKRPNIVFVLADGHSTQAISAYGSRINKTPNIDRLAKEGAILLNTFCNNASSGPSRASILTGRYSHAEDIFTSKNRLNPKLNTFPQILQKSGYQTALFGRRRFYTEPKGFDSWEILKQPGRYYNPEFHSPKRKSIYNGYVTSITTDLSIEWLQKRDKTKPFFLMCNHLASSRTWTPDLKHLDKYKDTKIPEPLTLKDQWQNRSRLLPTNLMSIRNHLDYAFDLKIKQKVPFATRYEKRFKDPERHRMNAKQKNIWDKYYSHENNKFLKNPPLGEALHSWKYQRFIKNYLRCIDSVDENLGRVLDYLDENNLTENTIVIYSSDHGFFLGNHGLYNKGWMFEDAIRIPCLIRWPNKISAGLQLKQLTQNIDLAPTLIEAAKLAPPSTTEGKSLIPLLSGSTEENLRDSI